MSATAATSLPTSAAVASATSEEAVAAAAAAGLRYVSDGTLGIARRPAGEGFDYTDPHGSTVTDETTLQRIRSLAIPPAWTDVWICGRPDGHLQATGRDARGRKQYRYHPRWREFRDETKFHRMIAFGEALPGLRRRVARDLQGRGLERTRVVAAVVRLLDISQVRVGNQEYARANRSYGLTTLRTRHVAVTGARLVLDFRGKSGKRHVVEVEDRRVANLVKHCQDLPGHELFQYVDESGERRTVDSADVNEYLGEFTAKDFRTWAGTVLAYCSLRDAPGVEPDTRGAREAVKAAIEAAAGRLGNTVTVCRKCYVHPDVIDAYTEGSMLRVQVRATAGPTTAGLRPEEREVLSLLRRAARRRDPRRGRGAA